MWIGCRAAGATEEAVSSFRMQRDIQRIGEAVGYASALASTTGASARTVDLSELFHRLEASGALPPPKDGHDDFGRVSKAAQWLPYPESGASPVACVERALFGKGILEAGLALWRTYRDRTQEAEARLREALSSGDDVAAWRAAAILGAWGEAVGLERLRNVAASGDTRPCAPDDATRADYTRASVAERIVGWHG